MQTKIESDSIGRMEVPYLSGYKSYSSENMKVIIDYATRVERGHAYFFY